MNTGSLTLASTNTMILMVLAHTEWLLGGAYSLWWSLFFTFFFPKVRRAHFTEETTEARRAGVPCPGSHCQQGHRNVTQFF